MRIEMLKRTYCCELGFLSFGEILDTNEGKLTLDRAERWVRIGMAKKISDLKKVNPEIKKEYVKPEIEEVYDINDIYVSEEEPSENVENENLTQDYSEYSAKELFGMCKDLDLDVESKMSREYYIEKLTSID